jgi:hypothetical protein
MFKLWYLAESDLLREGSYYSLTNTGQGRGVIQNKHSTDIASPPPPPLVFMGVHPEV